MMNKKIFILIMLIAGIMLNVFFINTPNVLANNNTTYITLSDDEITVNDNLISNDKSENIYLTDIMDNGGSSDEAIKANIEITNIININNSGIYEFTGKLSDGQISINSNNINGDVIIILNNVEIRCENAPAIFVYNTETKSSTCNITIKTAKESTNTIAGGKIKQSVEGWSDQSKILYYIDKGYDDDRNYYERYKYDGAISSDISLTFEGEGTLTVNSVSKEGIETKRDITINSGNYVINSLDDGINACTDNESVITINGGNVLVNVLAEAEEGDGIDSNGYIYINGGTVVATGNMADSVSKDSEQEFMQIQFKNKVSKDTLITILDEDKNPITAFKTDRAYSVLTISTPDFTDEEQYVYEGGNIEGTSENGLYTQINSYTEGTEKEYNEVLEMGKPDGFEKDIKDIGNRNNKVYYIIFVILIIVFVILVIIAMVLKKKGEFEMKGKILTLFIGILIGAIVTTAGFMIYNKVKVNSINGQKMMDGQMRNDGEMFDRNMPDGEPPEMPDGEGDSVTRPGMKTQNSSADL